MNIPYSDKEYISSKLIFDVTEDILIFMEDRGISKKQLAEKLNKDKSFVTQVLSGTRNMTLKTLSDICYELSLPLEIKIGKNKDISYYTDLTNNSDCSFDVNNLVRKDSYHTKVIRISEHPDWNKAA